MRPPSQEISWFASGWIAGQPPGSAWKMIAAGIATGLVVIVISYSFTLISIAPWRRATLCLLRLILLLALFLILAAPTRIERTYGHPPANVRPLAVLVD